MSKESEDKPEDKNQAGPKISTAMGVGICGCALAGAVVGTYLGLQINPIAAYVFFMLGTAGGAMFGVQALS